MLRVGINGFGTIGKRVADAVRAQPDMRVAGVAKRTPNYEAVVANDRGYALYTASDDGATAFRSAGMTVAGEVDDLVAESDVIVDATPAGVGVEYRSLYELHDTPAIFQGGESADVAPVSFVSRANYDAASEAGSIRVVSCNTTGLTRLLTPLEERFGIDRARATLVRRGGDPAQSGRGPINDTLPDPVEIPSHHGPDVRTVLPDLDITTMGLKVPATLMHTHSLNVTLSSSTTVADVRDLLAAESRILVLPEYVDIDGAGKLTDFTSDAGRPRGDLWENCVWGASLSVEDCRAPGGDGATVTELSLFQAIHQQADVVPENVDAIRAITGAADYEESVERTDAALGIDAGLLPTADEMPEPTPDPATDD